MVQNLDFQGYSDRLPPQNVEAEEAILGGILLDPEAIGRVMEILNADAFYISAHKTIYRAAMDLHSRGLPTDLMTVTNWLKDRELLEKVGGTSRIAQLVDRTLSAANIDQYATLVMEKYMRRRLIQIGGEISQLGFEAEQPLELSLDEAEQKLFGITQDRPQQALTSTADILIETFAEIEERAEGIVLPGVPCGFYDLDAMTQGFQRSDLIIAAGRPSMGKCLGKGTRVVMADGTLKAVEDIQVGEHLLGPDSKPRKVLSLARGREMMYWVRQKRGIDYRVNESHILSLKASGTEGTRIHGQVVNISVKDYLNKSDKFRIRHKGYKVAVDFPEQPVPVNPYLLGAWLGDGHSTKTVIFNVDEQLQDAVAQICKIEGYRTYINTVAGKCPEIRIRRIGGGPCLQVQLKELGVWDEKGIPQIYRSNSREVRLELLAGLMDADGYYCPHMQCFENTQKSKRLAEDIKFLGDSLGFRTSIVKKKGSIKASGFESEYWRVRLSGNLEIVPNRIPRKQARPYQSIRDWRVTGIEVEADCVDDYYGFEIDGDRLFLLEDMTVTHNTAFVLNIARNIASTQKLPVAIFSLEMSKQQLVYRLLSSELALETSRLRTGRLNPNEWTILGQGINQLSEMPIFIDDTPNISVNEMRSKARRLQAEQGGALGLVLIDYLQLMEGSSDNRVQELSKITRSLKGLARELNVPIISLSQLSRGVESRTNKRPMMSDLRESGSIEQDADVIMMLYREEYYDPDTPDRGIAEIIITKHRNGPTGTVKLLFEPQYTRFRNLAQPPG
jgi:replicative DNA helicase